MLKTVLRKLLRVGPKVVVVLLALAGAAFAVERFALSDDPTPTHTVRASVQSPGSFESAHPFAPYYVVPRKRFDKPSDLSRQARNKIVSAPESALSKGALAGSPQIVRLQLRATGDDTVTVTGVRFRPVSDARPLRGWFTALSGCQAKPVRRAQADLDERREETKYVSSGGVVSKRLALEVKPGAPQTLELRAATARHRVAWTAELSAKDAEGHASTVTIDDGGEPFRVTSTRDSVGYEPVYGATGIIAFSRSRTLARGSSRC